MIDINKLVRPNIAQLKPYSTARDDYKGGNIDTWLDANESPYDNGTNRYPDPRQKELKLVISALKKVEPEQLFIGNGSDEAIDLAYRIFCQPARDNAVAITPSYGMYEVAAAINDVELRQVRLRSDFSLPVEEMMAQVDKHTKLIWICSPNNPTGNAFDEDDIISLLKRFQGIVVVDEAYADFSSQESLVRLINDFPNLIVLQTLSKARGMAALRVGLAFSNPEIIDYYGKVKYPYNISGLVQKVAIEALRVDINAQVDEIRREREILSEQLMECDNVKQVYPSDANFLLVKVSNARSIYDALIEQGVIVRNRSNMPGCEECLRITIGTPSENRKVIDVIKSLSL